MGNSESTTKIIIKIEICMCIVLIVENESECTFSLKIQIIIAYDGFELLKMLFSAKADPAGFVSYQLKKRNSAQESIFHFLHCLRTANRTDGFLYGTLVDMTTLCAMLMVPDQFINSKILTAASGTHDTSLTITPYGHNKKNIILNFLTVICQQKLYTPPFFKKFR